MLTVRFVGVVGHETEWPYAARRLGNLISEGESVDAAWRVLCDEDYGFACDLSYDDWEAA